MNATDLTRWLTTSHRESNELRYRVDLSATAAELAQVYNAIADDAALDRVSRQLARELDRIHAHPGQLVLDA